MPKTILILDGDSIAFRCSAAGEARSVEVLHNPSGLTKVFKHRTEFKEHMQSRGKVITEDYSVTDKQEPEPLSYTLNTINQHIARIVKEVRPDEVKIFAGESSNFRLDLALPSKYKGNRSGNTRPVHLAEAKKFLVSKHGAKESVGKEVDDDCSIAAYDALRNGDKAVMYFYEKDQFQLDGVTLLYDEDTFRYETVPDVGELHMVKNAVKGLGLKFLAYQWICSDPVDNYCAYELSNIRFGAKSAYNVLNECNTAEDILSAVLKQFKKFYPEDFDYVDHAGNHCAGNWRSMMQMYYKCARMMRSANDKLDCNELFSKYNMEAI